MNNKNARYTTKVEDRYYIYNSDKDIDVIFYLGDTLLNTYDEIDSLVAPEFIKYLDNVVYGKPNIRFKYRYNSGSLFDFKESIVDLKADNAKNFTKRELLFKINKATYYNLKHDSHNFLEGLGYIETQKDGVELFELYLAN